MPLYLCEVVLGVAHEHGACRDLHLPRNILNAIENMLLALLAVKAPLRFQNAMCYIDIVETM